MGCFDPDRGQHRGFLIFFSVALALVVAAQGRIGPNVFVFVFGGGGGGGVHFHLPTRACEGCKQRDCNEYGGFQLHRYSPPI